MKITLESGSFGWDYLIVAEDGRDLLIQVDTDYPGVASTFGWSPSLVLSPHDRDADNISADGAQGCEHGGTDGTIACDCGATATEFIASAQEWLDDHIGEEAEDPGYFGEED